LDPAFFPVALTLVAEHLLWACAGSLATVTDATMKSTATSFDRVGMRPPRDPGAQPTTDGISWSIKDKNESTRLGVADRHSDRRSAAPTAQPATKGLRSVGLQRKRGQRPQTRATRDGPRRDRERADGGEREPDERRLPAGERQPRHAAEEQP